MNKNTIIFIIAFLTIVVIVVYTLQGGETAEQYSERINAKRKEIETFMLSDESPLSGELKKSFEGLHYYSPDRNYKVIARIEPVEDQKLEVMATSTGEQQKYIKFGIAKFKLAGKECQLVLLQPYDDKQGSLFLPFTDQTNGKETYGGGRYINLALKNKNSIEIDFNLAYNPYCVYNPTYSCPIPPKENNLQLPIYAGEKNFKN
jgi:uncharacterized protein